jgi:hypothetical protein
MAAGLKSQFGPSDFNAKFILNVGWTVKVPNAKWATSHGSVIDKAVLGGLLNNWEFGGIYNARSGSPINVTLAGDVSGTDDRPQRPQLVPGVSPTFPGGRHRAAEVQEWFNTAAFQNPAYGTFGNVSRNSLVGPGYINLNADLRKNYNLPGAGHTLEFRVDAYNLFNTPNLSNPSAELASSTSSNVNFGKITATVGTNGVVGSNGRRLQLGGIIHF